MVWCGASANVAILSSVADRNEFVRPPFWDAVGLLLTPKEFESGTPAATRLRSWRRTTAAASRRPMLF